MPAGISGRAPAAGVALRDTGRVVRGDELPGLIEAERTWLAGCGGRRFGLLADNSVAWALTDLALHELGTLNVPLPGYFTVGQVAHALNDAGVDAVLTDSSDRLQLLDPAFRIAGLSPNTGLTLLTRPVPAPPVVPTGTVKVTYTSGSTAAPKGVCLTARNIDDVVSSVTAATAGLKIERHLCVLPLPTLLENIAGLQVALASGACCELRSMATLGISYGGVNPAAFINTLTAAQPSSLILVPELLRLVVSAAAAGWQVPASLRFIAVGGAVMAPELLARAATLGLPVFEGYGLSECGSVVALNRPDANRPGSVGRPLPHVRLRLDARGEIFVRGAGHAGYLGGPPASSELATGELGELDADGYLYVRGRLGNLIITSLGRNISPEWVERELAFEPAVGAAMVVGEAQPWLGALISPAAGADRAAVTSAVARANTRLPDYARIRCHALVDQPFSVENGLLTVNGRLRRDRILDRHAPLIQSLYQEAAAS